MFDYFTVSDSMTRVVDGTRVSLLQLFQILIVDVCTEIAMQQAFTNVTFIVQYSVSRNNVFKHYGLTHSS